MDVSGCFWAARLGVRGGEGTLVIVKFVIQIDIFNFLLFPVACIHYSGDYSHHCFYRIKRKVKKIWYVCQVGLDSKWKTCDLNQMWLQTSVFSAWTQCRQQSQTYKGTVLFALVNDAVWLLSNRYISVHRQLWFSYLFARTGCLKLGHKKHPKPTYNSRFMTLSWQLPRTYLFFSDFKTWGRCFCIFYFPSSSKWPLLVLCQTGRTWRLEAWRVRRFLELQVVGSWDL